MEEKGGEGGEGWEERGGVGELNTKDQRSLLDEEVRRITAWKSPVQPVPIGCDARTKRTAEAPVVNKRRASAAPDLLHPAPVVPCPLRCYPLKTVLNCPESAYLNCTSSNLQVPQVTYPTCASRLILEQTQQRLQP
jgi:hypothetical protein